MFYKLMTVWNIKLEWHTMFMGENRIMYISTILNQPTLYLPKNKICQWRIWESYYLASKEILVIIQTSEQTKRAFQAWLSILILSLTRKKVAPRRLWWNSNFPRTPPNDLVLHFIEPKVSSFNFHFLIEVRTPQRLN